MASKDDPTWFRVYEACSRHIENFLSTLIYAGSNSIGSVEALLILAEWAPQRPQENSAIGCGQEDHGAWMLVGMAIRLGYLQRLEQAALVPDDGNLSQVMSRKRVVWAGKLTANPGSRYIMLHLTFDPFFKPQKESY